MDYGKATNLLTGRNEQRRKIANNTYLERRGENIAVHLHSTDVLTFHPNGDVQFDTAGWKTVTTKQRMNKFQNVARIWSDKGVWYVRVGTQWQDNTEPIPYADGLIVHSDGSVTGQGEDPARMLKLKRKIKSFVSEYMEAFSAGNVPAPSNGDCFYCHMVTDEGRSLGEVNHDVSHLESHITEKYFVPSLLVRAIKRFPVAPVGQHVLAIAWSPESSSRYPEGITKAFGGSFERIGLEQLTKSLKRYMTEQFGMQS